MNENNDRLVFLWSSADSGSTLGADSLWFLCLVLTFMSYLLFFCYFNFVLVVLRQFWYQSKHRSIWSNRKSIQNQTKKKIHRIFSTTRNPATPPPSKSLHDISAKPHQTTISQYPHVSSHQKVTRQPKPFDPTTNKPHLSILATVEAPHQLLEKPATTTHKTQRKKAISHQPRPTNQPSAAAAHQPPAADPSATAADTIFALDHLCWGRQPPPMQDLRQAAATPPQSSSSCAAAVIDH